MTPRSDVRSRRNDDQDADYTFVANPRTDEGGLVVSTNCDAKDVRDMVTSAKELQQDLNDKLNALRVWPKLTQDVGTRATDPVSSSASEARSNSGLALEPNYYPRHSAWSSTVAFSRVKTSADYFLNNPIAGSHPLRTPASFHHFTRFEREESEEPAGVIDPRDLAPRRTVEEPENDSDDSSSEDQLDAQPGPSRKANQHQRSLSPIGGSKKTLFVGHRKHTREVRPRGRAGAAPRGPPRPYKCKYVDPVTNDRCSTGGCVKVYDLLRHLVTMHAKDELAHVENKRLAHHPNGEPMLPGEQAAPLLQCAVRLAQGCASEADWVYMNKVGVTKRFDCAAAVRKNLLGLAMYLRCWATSEKFGGKLCGSVFPRQDTLSKHLREQHQMSVAENNSRRPSNESQYDRKKLTLLYGSKAQSIEPAAFGVTSSGAVPVGVAVTNVPSQDDTSTGRQRSESQPASDAHPSTSTSTSDQATPSSAKVDYPPSPIVLPGPPIELQPARAPPSIRRTVASLPSLLGTDSSVPRAHRTPNRSSASLPLPLTSPRRHASFRIPRSPASRSVPSQHNSPWGLRAAELSPFLPNTVLELSPTLSTPSSLPSVPLLDSFGTSTDSSPNISSSPWATTNTLGLIQSLSLGSPHVQVQNLEVADTDMMDDVIELARSGYGYGYGSEARHGVGHGGLESWHPTPDSLRLPTALDSPDVLPNDTHDLPLPEAVAELYTMPHVAHPHAGAFSGAVYKHAIQLHNALLDPESPEYQRLSEQRFVRENDAEWERYINFDGNGSGA